MIPRGTLEAILPNGDPPELPLDPREVEAIGEDNLLLRIAKWREAIRRAFINFIVETPRDSPERMRSLITPATTVGIGVIDVPENESYWTSPTFNRSGQVATRDGYTLGVAIYSASVSRNSVEELPVDWLPLPDSPGVAVPIVLHRAEWTRHHHPSGGRAAAVVSDGPNRYLLTARHVVAKKHIGARVDLFCGNNFSCCHCSGIVAMKGPLYLDVALIRIQSMPCQINTSKPVVPRAASLGATVRHHFGSSAAALPATITQAVGLPGTFINPAAPLTFLTDKVGVKGDSGSAITSDGPRWPSGSGTCDLIGTYSGQVRIRMPGPTGRTRELGFGHDAFEAMQLFGTMLQEGVYP